MNNTITITKTKLSYKAQTLAALLAIVGAVALPQAFHMLGIIAGTNTALGETFLPMHLSIMLVGLLAGPYAGAVAGIASPLISFALTGMPGIVLLPFMAIELCVYGLASGLLMNVKMPTVCKVLIVQVSGRTVRALAIIAAVNILGNTKIKPSIIWSSIPAGIFGIVLQLVLIPLIVYRLTNLSQSRKNS